jgi:hypothetical protein
LWKQGDSICNCKAADRPPNASINDFMEPVAGHGTPFQNIQHETEDTEQYMHNFSKLQVILD